jgi:glutamine amidotransferase
VLFGMTLSRLDKGASPQEALVDMLSDVLAITTGAYNIMLFDGRTLWTTVYRNTLFVQDRAALGQGVVVASEPFDDDPDWERVDDEVLVVATADGIEITPLGL